jgi:hypothetical protein
MKLEAKEFPSAVEELEDEGQGGFSWYYKIAGHILFLEQQLAAERAKNQELGQALHNVGALQFETVAKNQQLQALLDERAAHEETKKWLKAADEQVGAQYERYIKAVAAAGVSKK